MPDTTSPTAHYLDSDASHAAAGVLECFSRGANLSFDRLKVSRLLAESTRAIPGDDSAAWARRMLEVGESLDLRVRGLECSLDEILVFAQQEIPVATCRPRANGQDEWILITNAKGNRVCISGTNTGGRSRWMSKRRLRKRLRLAPRSDAPLSWVVGQSALPCEAASRRGEQLKATPLSPLSRLIQMVWPDRSDLFAIFVFSVVVGVLALASPIAVEALVNTVAFGRYLQPVVVLALILLIFLGFAALLRALNTYVVEVIQRRLFVRVVEDLAYRLPRVEHKALDTQYGPELVNRFFDVVTLQKVVASILLDGIGILLQTTIGMAVLAFYHPYLLGFDIVLLLLIAFVIFGLGRGAVKTSIKESKQKYAVEAWLEEIVRHPTAFKLHGGTQFAMERADKLAVDYLDARKAHFRIVLRQVLCALGLQAVAATVLLGSGGWLVILGELSLGQLVAAELIVMLIVSSFAKLGKHMESFYDLLASVDKLGALFDLSVEEHDRLFHLAGDGPASVAFENVTYEYGATTGVSSLSFEIDSGKRVALIGPAGCGKSTIIDLACGMRIPSKGHVEIDGSDVRELRPDSLRECLAVARGVEIFQGTIAENVHLNRPQISSGDIREALDSVGLLASILDLPEGLNTRLLTDGKPLSSSQAQRLMIARALAGRPRLLLLDGCLDALPLDLLETVVDGVMPADRRWTLLIATSRQGVWQRCDQLIRLGGVEEGGHVSQGTQSAHDQPRH